VLSLFEVPLFTAASPQYAACRRIGARRMRVMAHLPRGMSVKAE
jgi:hypothetical protein